MPEQLCNNCGKTNEEKARFCTECGSPLGLLSICTKCGYKNTIDAKFCPECGTSLQIASKSGLVKKKSSQKETTIEPPPSIGITIEFPVSTSQSYEFAVSTAQKIETYKAFGEGKKTIHRVTIPSTEVESIIGLLEQLSGWRRRTVYVDGEKLPWDSVFGFKWCYEKKKGSYKPEYYCFGYESDYEINIWGCKQSGLPFTEHAEWFCWGEWLNNKADWKFDKERIRHELEKSLFHCRFCPAIRSELVESALNALPDIVNPTKDRQWKFVEKWGDEITPTLIVKRKEYGIVEEIEMKGVCPNGNGALVNIAKKLSLRLPEGN